MPAANAKSHHHRWWGNMVRLVRCPRSRMWDCDLDFARSQTAQCTISTTLTHWSPVGPGLCVNLRANLFRIHFLCFLLLKVQRGNDSMQKSSPDKLSGLLMLHDSREFIPSDHL
jgi:hypothetical protein